MRLVLAGVSGRDKVVFEIFLTRDLPGWTCQLAPEVRDSSRPSADILVLDLVALGLSSHSEANQAALLQCTQGTPAVLLLPAFERGWTALDPDWMASHQLVWLVKPYGTQAMRGALKAAAAMVQMTTPASLPQPLPKPPVPSLTAAALGTRLEALPAGPGLAFLRQLSSLLQQAKPFEARFTVQNSLIVHPVDGWVASNTPLAVMQQVCRSDVLASAVSMRVLDGPQAEERTHQLGMRPTELDTFLWALVSATQLAVAPTP